MRKFILMILVTGAFAAVGTATAVATNPPGNGKPGQSCQELEPNVPGHAAESPGSPFNEEEINSEKGGIGGQNYNENSQYDVACFQLASH